MVTGTQEGVLYGRRAMDWLQQHYSRLATTHYVVAQQLQSIPHRPTARWRHLHGLQRAWGNPAGCPVYFWRERRTLNWRTSNYVVTLRNFGIAKPLRNVQTPTSGVAITSPVYGRLGYHWNWRNNYAQLSPFNKAILIQSIIAGRRTAPLAIGARNVTDFIQTERAYDGDAPTPSRRIIIVPETSDRFRAMYRPGRVGIWR